MTEYPVERPRPDHDMYRGIPRAEPGQGLMVCPTENTLMVWDYLPDDELRCTGCGRVTSRKKATGQQE